MLQNNYYAVQTLLIAPGRLVLLGPTGAVRLMSDLSPSAWLARELEGGNRQQPSKVQ